MNSRYDVRPARALASNVHPARALLSMLALTAGLIPASLVHAASYDTRGSRSHSTVDGNLVDVQIQVDGSGAPLYYRPGAWDRHYFQAFQGRNYSVILHNTTNQRIGVLLTVDGLNAIDGRRSQQRSDEPLYVLDPWETATIRGWRTSLDEVRRFVFVDEERSYAERTGQANGDLGWIRVSTFKDRDAQPMWGWGGDRSGYRDGRAPLSGRERAESSAPAPSAPSAPGLQKDGAQSFRGDSPNEGPSANSNPGTGWGDRRHDHVDEVDFRAVREASDQIVLRYEYASGLRALGINPRGNRLWDRERGELGFAQPPKW